MSWQDLGIEHKQVSQTVAAAARITIGSRRDLPTVLERLGRCIPRDSIAGPPFCNIRFVTSVKDGLEAEVGFPVRQAVETGGIATRTFPPLDVLSLLHTGPIDTLSESYGTLYRAAAEQGLISDEFAREVYPDWELAEWDRVEVQFVLHNWNALFAANLDRVLGGEARDRVMRGLQEPGVASTLDERFRWVKGVMGRLERLAREEQTYDIVSRCAHVFPREQIEKLRAVYVDALVTSDDPLDAVDAVIAFMGEDPGWGRAPRREGRIIYSTKAPRDPQAYEDAQSDEEKRRAYCFCPIVRNRLEDGMPPTFCYCGAGWYRQQWEGATGKAVSISIVRSILKGDDECQFAIRLPEDL
jgi:effector-binding domain-containing protein